MKITIFDIKKFAIHDGPGIRTTIFFKGCPLNCSWCHNPESRSSQCEVYQKEFKLNGKSFVKNEQIGRIVDIDEIIDEIEKDQVFYEESGGGVTFSGGEPLLQGKALKTLANKCNELGIHTTLDTTGFARTDDFVDFTIDIDLFLYDIKHLDTSIHNDFTRVSNKLILKNLDYLRSTNRNVIIRFPVIPNLNTTEDNLLKMDDYLLGIKSKNISKLHLLPYHRIGSHKYERFGIDSHNQKFYEPNDELLEKLKLRFEKLGFDVNIGG